MSPTDCSSPTVLQKVSGWPGASDTEVSRSNHQAAPSEAPTATTTSRIHAHPGTGLRRRPSSSGEVGVGSAMAVTVASGPARPGVLTDRGRGIYPMGYAATVAAPPLPRAPDGTVAVTACTESGASAWRALLGMGSCWWAAALVVGAVAFLAIGVPTAIVPTPIFGRRVAAHWWDVALLDRVVAAGRHGLGLAHPPRVSPGRRRRCSRADQRRSVVGGALTFLAVGCPTCNKLVLVALGTSGALSWFAPIQPLLGLVAVGLLAVTLRRRLRAVGPLGCAV